MVACNLFHHPDKSGMGSAKQRNFKTRKRGKLRADSSLARGATGES
jgi:hypothetical protein